MAVGCEMENWFQLHFLANVQLEGIISTYMKLGGVNDC